jgi:hypothetical protein
MKRLLGRGVLLVALAASMGVLGTSAPGQVPGQIPGQRPPLRGPDALVPRRAVPIPSPAAPPTPRFEPKFDALAETKLLMEGLAQPNFRALGKSLEGRPADVEAWTFARGQALLIAETGNLLLLRPPRNAGRDTWMREAMDMRESASVLARSLGARDLERSRANLAGLAESCNRCHHTFRVPVRIAPGGTERDTD